MNEQREEAIGAPWHSTVVHTVITALYLRPLQEKSAELRFLLSGEGCGGIQAKTYALILLCGT